MSCPDIKIILSKSFNNGDGTQSNYHSDASVTVISGTSTSPMTGQMVLHYSNHDVTVFLNNPTNSFTQGNFVLSPSALFDADTATITISLNNGSCVFVKTVILSGQEHFPCETTISGIGGINGHPIVHTDCYVEITMLGIDLLVHGCTDPLALNYNPLAVIDDGSCAYVVTISGCTDPNAANYNPLATVEDGSCTYIHTPVPKVLGCTNPLAQNYNSAATFNDGSCEFQSGCTNPISDNYNPSAVVDDGSCECSKAELIFDLNEQKDYNFVSSGQTGVCDYYLEYQYRIGIDCTQFIEYFDKKTTATILGILKKLKLFTEVKSTDSTYKQLEWNPDSKTTFPFELSGNTDDCKNLKELLSVELGADCPDDISSLFDTNWRTARLKIPKDFLDKIVNIGVYLEGFGFGVNLLVDNIKLYSICYNAKQECIIVPYDFGFDFDLLEDNIKSTINSDKLILNTKIIDLKINIPKYITNDLVQYCNVNEKLINKVFHNLSYESLLTEFLGAKDILTTDYSWYRFLYEKYLNSFDYCSNLSKGLTYEDMFLILNKIGDNWVSLIEQFLPSTVIWTPHTRFYSNILLHHQKFKYKKYFLTSGEDQQLNVTCTYTALDACGKNEPFIFLIDKTMKDIENSCIISTNYSPQNYSNSNYGGGRLIQYTPANNHIVKEYDYPTQIADTCI